MFVLASKLLDFFLMPTVWVALLLGVAWWKKSRKAMGLALLTFLVFTNGLISYLAFSWWELPATPLADLHREYPCAVVLGGFTHLGRKPNDRVYLNTAGDRIMHAVLLYKTHKTAKLLVSGGNGALIKYDDTEAENAARLAELCGLPASAILTEKHARTTYENALFCKRMLDSLQIKDTVLLITSAFHARRAAACFLKAGVPFRLFTTDFRIGRSPVAPDRWLLPTSDALARWDMLLHEWGGYLVYKLLGYA